MNNIKVNYSFISELEGGAQLKGYVPDAANSKSGVTIATGFDIGQRSREDLERMFFIARPSLIDKLLPYCEQHGEHAQMMLNLMPLKVSEDEATLIDGQGSPQAVNRGVGLTAEERRTTSNRVTEVDRAINGWQVS